MLNVAKLSQAIGQVVVVKSDLGLVRCVVSDVRKVWNRVDLLVRVDQPGIDGETWVSMDRVSHPSPAVRDLATA